MNNNQTELSQADTEVSLSDIPAVPAGSVFDAMQSAIEGDGVFSLGRIQIYTDHSIPGESVVFMHDPVPGSEHKYIQLKDGERTFTIAGPVSAFPFHKVLRRCLWDSGYIGECTGGGYVSVKPNGELIVDQLSIDFGMGDHKRAKAAFERAVLNASSA